MMLATILAQVIDPSNGAAAGWGAFGLSGAILMWLFFKHLPSKDAQLDALLVAKDNHVQVLVANFTSTMTETSNNFTKTITDSSANFTKTMTEAIASFAKEQQYERDQCLRLHAENMAEHRAATAMAQTHHHETRNLLSQLRLDKAIEEVKRSRDAAEKQGQGGTPEAR